MKKEILDKVVNAHKNLIVEGDVFSGKTSNVMFSIVDEMIENNESLFILDSREEYVNKYFNKLKEKNYNTIILNLRDMDKSECWNPLLYPYNLYKNGNSDKAQEYLEKIGKTLFYESGNVDPFWSITASDFFTGVALAMFEDAKEDEINFNNINYMFSGIDKKYGATDYLTEYFKTKGVTSKPYVFASTTILAPKDTKGSILSVARQKLRLLVSSEKLSYLMNQTTFNVDDIVNKPTAIIIIARDENKSLNTLVSMFIEQLYAILVENKCENKFNFILDNFDIVENCNDLNDILSSCTSRNIRLFICTRSLEELSKKYGSYLTKLCDLISIRSNDLKLIFGNIEEMADKNFDRVVVEHFNIEYPTLNKKEIKIFDFEKLVHSLKMYSNFTNPFNVDMSNANLGEPFKMDDLIKSVDDKIDQLELEEKMDIAKKHGNSPKSELEQFKIDEKNN